MNRLLTFIAARLLLASIVVSGSAIAQSLEQVLPRPGDTAQYYFKGFACSDDHNCSIPAFYFDPDARLHFMVVERTTDGGKTWTQQPGPFAPQLAINEPKWTEAIAVDSLNVFAFGESGMIARTTDAGSTWEDISIPEYRRLATGSFLDAKNGMLVGGGGLAIITSDGGNSWDTIPSLPFAFLTSVKMFDNDRAAIYAGAAGRIYYTNDRWETIDSLPPLWDWNLETPDRKRGIIRLIWRSETEIIGVGGVQYPRPGQKPPYEDRPYMMRSTDGGRSWTEIYDAKSHVYSPMDISIHSSGVGILGGFGTGLLWTSDHGKTWTDDTLATDVGFREVSDLHVVNENTALIDLSILEFGKIFLMTFGKADVEYFPRKIVNNTHIYPNPSNGTVTIQKWYETEENIEFVDVVGRVVKSAQLNPGFSSTTLDCSSLLAGVYTLRVRVNGLRLPAGHVVLMR